MSSCPTGVTWSSHRLGSSFSQEPCKHRSFVMVPLPRPHSFSTTRRFFCPNVFSHSLPLTVPDSTEFSALSPRHGIDTPLSRQRCKSSSSYSLRSDLFSLHSTVYCQKRAPPTSFPCWSHQALRVIRTKSLFPSPLPWPSSFAVQSGAFPLTLMTS